MPLHPTVLWAQRNDVIYLTVEISDIKVITGFLLKREKFFSFFLLLS